MILPPLLAPPPPFPGIASIFEQDEVVAPGVERATYRLATAAGPLVVHVVDVDVHRPDVRLRVVVARDRLVSPGETVSAMAARTSAVAGVNGDYFDIGQTNQPLNVVVRNGTLARTPSRRIALAVDADDSVRFVKFAFSGTLTYGTTQVPLTSVDEWPPERGASLLLPDYGMRRGAEGVRLFALEPLMANLREGATYRVVREEDGANAGIVTGPTLALGPAALALAPPPVLGDTVAIATRFDPPLDDVAEALGGGPLLVRGGSAFDDPDAPAPEERNRRFPVSGAATAPDGDLVLFAVDGDGAAQSVGLTRPEFGALMLAFGARDGMAFDSGGSSTLVARVLGDERASVVNSPSDGLERPVADGLFVYSNAPRGRDPHLVVQPSHFAALPGARIALRGAIVDDASNWIRNARVEAPVAEAALGHHVVTVTETGGEHSTGVAYDTVVRPARVTIDPVAPNPDPDGVVRFRVRAVAQDGTQVELGDSARWRADRGTIDDRGIYRATDADAIVGVDVAGVTARVTVRVGRHDAPLDMFDPEQSARWKFRAIPQNLAGGVALVAPGELDLSYDFSEGGRAAYADADFALPGEPLALGVDVRGDASAIGIRAAFVNRFGERRALTLVKTLDWSGWRRVSLVLPPDLNPPVRLVSLYAVSSLGGMSTRSRGTLAFRAPSVVLPGTAAR